MRGRAPIRNRHRGEQPNLSSERSRQWPGAFDGAAQEPRRAVFAHAAHHIDIETNRSRLHSIESNRSATVKSFQ